MKVDLIFDILAINAVTVTRNLLNDSVLFIADG